MEGMFSLLHIVVDYVFLFYDSYMQVGAGGVIRRFFLFEGGTWVGFGSADAVRGRLDIDDISILLIRMGISTLGHVDR